MRSNKGVTLITLSITIIILIILTFTITINMNSYTNKKTKSDFDTDMKSLEEEINQYYARVKELPLINRFTNIDMLSGIKNINDSDEYYVIDIKQLEVNLNYGKDYVTIENKNDSEEITNLLDVYIINKQSHTIYYPKGIEYNGKTYYAAEKIYSEIVI